MKYSYDEEGLTFYFFVLTLAGLYVIPSTIKLLWSSTEKFRDTVNCGCEECKSKKRKVALLKKLNASKFGWLRYVLLVVGWALFLFSLKTVYERSQNAKIYDPFEVLGVSTGSDEKAIKRAYKVLSLKWHPDKAKTDEDRESFNAKFVEINKAYKTLTDEKSRKNWEDYGNPDGPQTFSLGIALPSWMVSSGNAFFVLALYVLGFGLGVPFLVSRSWSGSKRYTKNGILHSTMGMFYQEMREAMSMKKIAELISLATEFRDDFVWTMPAGEAETQKLVDFVQNAEGVSGDKFERGKKGSVSDISVRVNAMLYAHFNRIKLTDPTWEEDQSRVVIKAVQLAQGMLQIAIVREWVVTALNCMTIMQFLTQACWEHHSPLLQLPDLTLAMMKHFKTKKRTIRTIREYLETEEPERRDLVRSLTDTQYGNLIKVARAFPDINVLEVSFKVLGQAEITPSGIITCVVKLKLVHMEDAMKNDYSNTVVKNGDNGESIEQFEFDEDGNVVERSKALEASVSANSSGAVNAFQPVHAPYFPQDKKPHWWVLLLAPSMNAFVCPPIKVTDLVTEKSVTLQFAGPARPGPVSLNLLVRSDCLYGADIMMEVKFVVEPEREDSKPDSDWEISDVESDAENPFSKDD